MMNMFQIKQGPVIYQSFRSNCEAKVIYYEQHICHFEVSSSNQLYLSLIGVCFFFYLQKTPNYPDFKHKDTGESLWVEGRYNPPWVKSQLAILDTKMESFHNQTASMHSSDNFPFQFLLNEAVYFCTIRSFEFVGSITNSA